ncbi:MAG TPA: metallophosphoesterase family protein [Terriglobales bacterium]|nr:metallophosphoesterase family protein [Terriglobales bacterium]
MRVLLLSDIHSNLEALEACLAAVPAHDMVVNLGDLVGYGASPNEVIERSRSSGGSFVRGNHDRVVCGAVSIKDFNPVAGLAALWTREHLTPENMEWLRSLPPGPIRLESLTGIQFVHGSPLDEDQYVISEDDAALPLQISTLPLTFFGHTHLQGGFLSGENGSEFFQPTYNTIGQEETCELSLEAEQKYMINPGSVGQPRDGDWRAAFATFDTETQVVTFHRVPYDVRAAQARILAANLPVRLATRLAAGK